MERVRTRFAPSPTGYMHIGNLRTALYAYLVAKKHNGDFLLRIEDTDQSRQVEGAIDIIYETLAACGLKHDEGPDVGGEYGPYVQSERMKSGIYKEYAWKLVDLHKAHVCFCKEEDIAAQKEVIEARGGSFIYDDPCKKLSDEEVRQRVDAGEEYVIRQNIDPNGKTSFDDEVYGRITVDNETLDEMILLKSDGFPTYNFANVIDDHLMAISDVVRGNEYLSSAPKYNLIYEALGWEIPRYIHCPPVMKMNTTSSPSATAMPPSRIWSPRATCRKRSSTISPCSAGLRRKTVRSIPWKNSARLSMSSASTLPERSSISRN